MVLSELAVGFGLVVGLGLQWLVLRVADRPELLARPNQRSSHKMPTPTMGGVMIVLVVLGYVLWVGDEDLFRMSQALAVVALVGLWDDLRDLPSSLRLGVHFAASAWVLLLLPLGLPAALFVVAVVALAWFVNLYNFMDGIDGIAAAQCLVYCVGAQVLAGTVPGAAGELLWLLSGCTIAFLAFNWPPARIFMGDVGSGFLGLLIGAMVVYLAALDVVPLVGSLILLAVFWFDATYTLCVRMLTRQDFTQAHRSHLYQRLAQARGHLWTTVAFLIYAAGWLIPLAWLSSRFPSWQILALILSIGPLAWLAWRHRAGQPGE